MAAGRPAVNLCAAVAAGISVVTLCAAVAAGMALETPIHSADGGNHPWCWRSRLEKKQGRWGGGAAKRDRHTASWPAQ